MGQPQDQELESIAGIDNLVENPSLRGKVARWAAVAVSVVGIALGMSMPSQAVNQVEGKDCSAKSDFFKIYQGPERKDAEGNYIPTMCFANAGDIKVLIDDVYLFRAGNNAGYIEYSQGRHRTTQYFNKNGRLAIGDTEDRMITFAIERIVIY